MIKILIEMKLKTLSEKIAIGSVFLTLLTIAGCKTAAIDSGIWDSDLNFSLDKQSHVVTSEDFPFAAEDVWSLIAGFNTLPDYHASILASELHSGGAVRDLTLSDDAGGGIVVERLVYFNDLTMTFSYCITGLIDCDLAFRNYQARVRVIPTGASACRVIWESSFDVEGATQLETEDLAKTIYQGCYDGITRVLAKG